MQAISKIVFGTCALVTVAQGARVARADNQSPNQPPSSNRSPTGSDRVPTPAQQDPTAIPPAPEPSVPDSSTTNPAPVNSTPIAAPSAAMVDTAPTSDIEVDPLGYAWHDNRLSSGVGISAILGAGVVGFTDRTMRSTTADVGGLWDLRVTLGSHLPLALDVSYLGSATNINGLPTGQSGTLIGTTAEAALRYNILPHYTWNPYVFAGAGWQRYDVTNAQVSLADSGINNHDNLLEFPMGAGVAYRTGGFVADVRGTFRATTDQNLVLTTPALSPTSNDFAAMHTWEASAALGYEF
jgi:hypothetical protein